MDALGSRQKLPDKNVTFQDGESGVLLISYRTPSQELAKMVEFFRETLSRTFKALKKNGSLTVTWNTIYINRFWE